MPTLSAEAQGFVEVGAAAGFVLPQRASVGPRVCAGDPYGCLVDYTGGVAVGDLDGDGDPDVVLSRPDASMLVYANQGDGTFSDVSASMGLGSIPGANGVWLADLNADGRLDLLVSVIALGAARVYLNRYPEPFEERVAASEVFDFETPHPSSGFGWAPGDFDRDGQLDVFASHWGGRLKACGESRSRLYRGLPADDALLADVTEVVAPDVLDLLRVTWVSFGSAFADFDDDGWSDLLVTGDFSMTQFFWNDAGTFTRIAEPIGVRRFGMGSTIADFDQDGYLDIFMTGVSPELLAGLGHGLFLYRGARSFVDGTADAGVRTGGWGWGTAALDFDHDGDMDLVLATGDDFDGPEVDPIVFYRNNGDGTFTDVAAELGLADTEPGRGLAVFDYDGDGDQDIIIARNGLTPLLYRNDAGVTQGDYLRVRTAGTRGNGEGLGARVEVSVGGRTWVNEMNSISHFIGQSERVVHVGLGTSAEPRAASVRVRFLGGHEVLLEDVALNQELLVTEPDLPFPEPPAPPPLPAPDCDGNGTPDSCALDCDRSGTPDTCDVAAGRAPDCNANGVIDACELVLGFERDCDASGTLDSCEIAAEPSLDCDGDGWLDACRAAQCGGPDAGAGSPDAGVGSPDAGVLDAGAPRDAGLPLDAAPGADAGGELGVTGDAGPVGYGGPGGEVKVRGCSAGPGGSRGGSSALAGLLALGVGLARRRRA